MEEPTKVEKEEQDQPLDFQMEAEPPTTMEYKILEAMTSAVDAAAHMGMMRKVRLPGRCYLCKLSNVPSN